MEKQSRVGLPNLGQSALSPLLSYHQLWTTKFWYIKGAQQVISTVTFWPFW